MRSTESAAGLSSRKHQLGFSVVEMLMAAFIMAIGLLGLAMLQTMALRSNTGSKSMTSAVLVADRVLAQAEALGRNSQLCARNGSTPPALAPDYFGAATFTQYYKYDGTYSATVEYFRVTVDPTTVVSAAVAGMGGIKMVTVTVNWSEGVNSSNTAIPRSIVLSRRISYATS